MEKKVLVPTNGSPAASNALDYVGLMSQDNIRQIKVCLYYIMKPVPSFLRAEAQRDQSVFRRLRAMEEANRKEASQVLETGRERLLRRGLSQEQVETKAHPRHSDTVKDILFEAEQGMYDAVVMGRRDLSKLQELFSTSTTNKVVQHAERTPVWVVGSKVDSQKVLCPVDGSDGALKAVDHMAFMLGGNPHCQITLLHVGATLANYCPLDFNQELADKIQGDIMQSDERCMDDFYARAQRVLLDGGLKAEQIETLTVEGKLGVTSTILKQTLEGGFGTVVLGRRGEQKSFFLGHVADKVVAKLPQAAIWVVG
jgi:nucleotide-binding universal stress UspA family protein